MEISVIAKHDGSQITAGKEYRVLYISEDRNNSKPQFLIAGDNGDFRVISALEFSISRSPARPIEDLDAKSSNRTGQATRSAPKKKPAKKKPAGE